MRAIILVLLVFASGNAWADGYLIKIRQIDPRGAVSEAVCQRGHLCNLAINVRIHRRQVGTINVALVLMSGVAYCTFMTPTAEYLSAGYERYLTIPVGPNGRADQSVDLYVVPDPSGGDGLFQLPVARYTNRRVVSLEITLRPIE
jgi:hypothetical protein